MLGTSSADQFISFSGEAIHWLFTWSWQSFLLLGVAWVALKLDRSRSAATRYRIWLIAILAASALPLISALIHNLRLPIAQAPFPVVDIVETSAPVSLPQVARPALPWTSIIWPSLFVSWLAGVIISLLRLGNSLWRLYLIHSGARAVSLTDLDCSHSDLLHSETGVVSIALSERVQSPGVAGLFRPVILLPADIGSWTGPEERTSILHHELTHILRWDHMVNLFQATLTAFFFFHPMLRFACRQLSLERELACDDRVIGLGAKPKVYAEAILKAVERNFLNNGAYQMASFNSRKTLERRIDMIMNTNRMRQPLRQWRFLLAPVMLIGICAWLVIPAASSQTGSLEGYSQSGANGPVSTQPVSSTSNQTQLPPVVDRTTISVDSVSRRDLIIEKRGLGVLVPGASGRLDVKVQIAAPQARDIRIGQPASIDTRNGIVSGKVKKVGSSGLSGATAVDLSVEGALPNGAIAGLNVDATIEVDRKNDALCIVRPADGRGGGVSSLFILEEGGATATRVQVTYGKSSVNMIEIIDGLKEGDKVIISDMSRYAGVNTIKLN